MQDHMQHGILIIISDDGIVETGFKSISTVQGS